MGRDVQRGADVRFQVLEERLDRLQQGLRALLQRAPDSLEQLADLPLVVGLAAPERERCPERLADLLQQLLERAPRLGRGARERPRFSSRSRAAAENARRFVLRRPRPRHRSSRT